MELKANLEKELERLVDSFVAKHRKPSRHDVDVLFNHIVSRILGFDGKMTLAYPACAYDLDAIEGLGPFRKKIFIDCYKPHLERAKARDPAIMTIHQEFMEDWGIPHNSVDVMIQKNPGDSTYLFGFPYYADKAIKLQYKPVGVRYVMVRPDAVDFNGIEFSFHDIEVEMGKRLLSKLQWLRGSKGDFNTICQWRIQRVMRCN